LKEIQPVHPKGDQSWVFIGRTDVEAETPILWPLVAIISLTEVIFPCLMQLDTSLARDMRYTV